MLNSNSSHVPQASNGANTSTWDPASAWEFQAQLWNQLLELSRSFWAVYSAPLQAMPWLLNTAPPLAAAEVIAEPVAVSDATSDALESQARLWNHFLDASRNMWSSDAWALPDAPWLRSGTGASIAANEPSVAAAPARTRKPSRSAKSKAVRRR